MVKHRNRACRQKATYCFTGLCNSKEYGVYNTTIDTLEKAVKERVMLVHVDGHWREPWRPSEQQFNQRTHLFTSEFKKRVCYSNPMSPMAFAMTYQARKQTILKNAAEMNEKWGFHDSCARIKAFNKHEKYLFNAGKVVVPRLIQPRDHRYIVETGRYIKPIEKLVYDNINDIFGAKTVFKGLNMVERGNLLHSKWIKFKKPVAVGLDASRFDRHVSNSALRWEHRCYKMYYPGDKHFVRLMNLQLDNHGTAKAADGFLSYSTKHNRASGDSNTSLGNVLIMCALAFDYFKKVDLQCEFADDGDDCVVILEEGDLSKLNGIESFFRKAGFILVVEPVVNIFERIEFCQAQPVRNACGGYTMVRKVKDSLSKDAVALKPLDNLSVREKWMAAVGLGGLALTSGMPVLQDFYSVFVRESKGASPLVDTTMEGGFYRLSKGMEARFIEPTPETRLSFWLAFGITPSEQVSLEEYYRTLTLGVGDVRKRFNLLPY